MSIRGQVPIRSRPWGSSRKTPSSEIQNSPMPDFSGHWVMSLRAAVQFHSWKSAWSGTRFGGGPEGYHKSADDADPVPTVAEHTTASDSWRICRRVSVAFVYIQQRRRVQSEIELPRICAELGRRFRFMVESEWRIPSGSSASDPGSRSPRFPVPPDRFAKSDGNFRSGFALRQSWFSDVGRFCDGSGAGSWAAPWWKWSFAHFQPNYGG